MKPLKLVLNAFGPYASEQIIDFTLLGDNKIFLVTGNTGAGKTSIFDAISFALYGEASGNIRQADSFKSQFADDLEVCFVEFTFMLGKEKYHIYRSPKQQSLKRDKTAKELLQKAEFTMPSGDIISGVNAVDAKIYSLIGLNYQQFKQVVMLAQGEFGKLLQSPSDEKQQIFSQIFGTKIYALLADKLEEKEKILKQKIQLNKEQLSHIVDALISCGHNEFTEIPDILFADLSVFESIINKNLSNDNAILNDLDKMIKAVEQKRFFIDINSAKATNQKFITLEKIKLQLEGLALDFSVFEERKKDLEYIKAAAQLKKAEDIILSAKDLIGKYELQLNEFTVSSETAKIVYQKDCENYSKIPELENIKTKILSEITVLESQIQIFDQVEKLNSEHLKTRENLSLLQLNYNLFCTAKEIISYKSKISLIKASKIILGSLDKLTETYNIERELHLLCYRNFLDSQASVLARELKPDMPCPVCGSTTHPLPATTSKVISEEDVNSSKLKLDMLFSELKRCDNDYQLSLSDIKDFESEAAINSALNEKTNEFNLLLSSSSNKYNSLNDNVWIDSAIKNTEKLIIEAQTNIQNLVAQIEKLSKSQTNLASMSETAENLAYKKQQVAEIDKNTKKYSAEYIKSKSEYDTIIVNIKNICEYLEKNRIDFKNNRENFKNTLAEFGFKNYNSYRAFSDRLSELNSIEEFVNKYAEKSISAYSQNVSLLKELEGKSVSDISVLEHMISELIMQSEQLLENKSSLMAKIITTTERFSQIKNLLNQSSKFDKEYSTVYTLFQLAKGNNPQKISFERYVLASYFDEIIKMANIHLRKMNSSEFYLKRKENRSKRVQSGLDIDVVDVYTGKDRHVSTLSGGESFKASLALALGLADIIQIYSGGVNVETMFVDEGFGALDSESLDSAIDTLMSLQKSGRLVGIISHVPELRERIPAQLVVEKTKYGSHAKFVAN